MLNDKYSNINVRDVCNCKIDEEVERSRSYKPPLSFLLDYKKFDTASNWTLANKENDYKKIYFINMRNGYSMSLISRDPIKLTHKNKALTFNFTPCIYKNKFYKLPYFGVDVKRRDNRDFNENFDYSAFAYFDYLTAGTNMREGIYPEDLLKKILEERFFYFNDSDTSYDFKLYIREVNKKYEIAIKEYETLHIDSETNTVSEFVKELVNSNIDISNFLVKEFVLTENTKHKINKEEKLRLRNIFSIYDELLFKQIDFKLKNELYSGLLAGDRSNNRIGIEINTDIIRKWNATTHKPLLDSVGKDMIADIFIHTKGFRFSNYETDKMKVDSLCTTTSEITGTGILLNFDKARFVFPQKETAYNHRSLPLNVKNYPFFKKNINEKEKRNNYDITKCYDSLLTNFTGLKIPFSNIQIPINDVMLVVKGKDIIINNLFISGVFEIKNKTTSELNHHLELITDKFPIKISENDLLEHFKNLGIDQVKLKINENSVTIFFKKN